MTEDQWRAGIRTVKAQAQELQQTTLDRMRNLPPALFPTRAFGDVFKAVIDEAFAKKGAVWARGKSERQLKSVVSNVLQGTCLHLELERAVVSKWLNRGNRPGKIVHNYGRERIEGSEEQLHGTGVAFIDGSYCVIKRQRPSRLHVDGLVTRTQRAATGNATTNEATDDVAPVWFVEHQPPATRT